MIDKYIHKRAGDALCPPSRYQHPNAASRPARGVQILWMPSPIGQINWGAGDRAAFEVMVGQPSQQLCMGQKNQRGTRKRQTIREDSVAPPVDRKTPFR
jgi:hypothetical protein